MRIRNYNHLDVRLRVEPDTANALDEYAKDESNRRYAVARTISDEDYAAVVQRVADAPRFNLAQRWSARLSRDRTARTMERERWAAKFSRENVATMVLTDWARRPHLVEDVEDARRMAHDEEETRESLAQSWRNLGWGEPTYAGFGSGGAGARVEDVEEAQALAIKWQAEWDASYAAAASEYAAFEHQLAAETDEEAWQRRRSLEEGWPPQATRTRRPTNERGWQRLRQLNHDAGPKSRANAKS
jgi:hypothetical protein